MDGAEANPYAAVVPKFDFEQAVRLFWKGRSLEELTAAARRLARVTKQPSCEFVWFGRARFA